MKLVLLRHGQSIYNLEKRFTGWTDVPLTKKGIEEAKNAGKLLKTNNFKFDKAYTSKLKRAIDTLTYVKEEMQADIEITYAYELNERHYGALQGLKHSEMEEKYSKEQVLKWRRSYDERPPLLKEEDPRNPQKDPKYKDINKDNLPFGESLKDTLKRAVKYYNEEISPNLKEGKDILIVAHGNSLRALIKHIENISDEDILKVEIPTGIPYVYELDESLKIKSKHILKGE